MRTLWHNYSFGIVLGLLFLASWGAQAVVMLITEHQTGPQFWAATLENWQSEALQLLFQVAGLRWLLFKGSPQSKDDSEEVKREIARLRAAIERRM
jgi:hypothetical protein